MNGTPETSMRSVYLETFGCQMNVLDSQLVRGQLQGLGYRFIDDWRQADVILYNTCSVREHAEQKVWSRIGEVGVHKQQSRSDVVLGVIGCMAEREGVEMLRRHPQVDLICGPGELDKVPLLIDNAVRSDLNRRGGRHAGVALQGNTHRRSQTLQAAEDRLELIDLARSFAPHDHSSRSAYVRITRGCNKFCTYCVVPFTRGREIHRPPDHIVQECRHLVENGVREITLLGQTVNHYHFDHAAAQRVSGVVQPQVGRIIKNDGTGMADDAPGRANGARSSASVDLTSFAGLLARIHDEIPELQRLRFVTSFPRDFGDDILQVMRDRPRICRYLHVPVQSGSNRVLQRMNRGYSVEQFEDLVGRIREYLPDAEIASDIICGFPGETQADHQATAALLHRCRFKNVFIFKYSPRPGTAAARLDDDVPEAEKKRRNNELLSIQHDVGQQVHDRYVGRAVEVFVESISAREHKRRSGALNADVELRWERPETVTQLTGRTAGDLIVLFDGDESLVGQSVEVHIERAAPLSLFGRVGTSPVGSDKIEGDL